MQKNSLDLFINLIAFDQSLIKTEKEIKETIDSMALCNKEKEALSIAIQKNSEEVKALKKEVDLKELDMRTLDEKEKQCKERLAGTSNDKEYQAIKREMDMYKQQQHEDEDALVAIWNSYELAQKELDAKQKKFAEEVEEIDRLLLEKKERLEILNKIIATHSNERTSKEEGIPEEWLSLYTRMSSSVPNPVVVVENDSCTACFYKVPHQDVLTLQNGELLSCKGCYRLLYIKYEPAQEV